MTTTFNGKEYQGLYDLCRLVEQRPAVGLNTVYSRLRSRTLKKGKVSDDDIHEILYLSKDEYKKCYGERKTTVKINDKIVELNNYYAKIKNPAVKYNIFRQRVKSLESRDRLDEDSIIDAYSMDRPTWISFFGGGRKRKFVYEGDIYPNYKGNKFSSVSSFLRTVDQYDKKSTVWSRLKAGWSLDDAISEPTLNLDERNGTIYVITNIKTSQSYIGLTVMSIDNRWHNHIRTALELNGRSPLHASIREYGVDSFTKEIIEDDIHQNRLPLRERYWIDKLNTQVPNGLNVLSGGQIGGGRKKKIVYMGRQFNSLTEAAFTLSQETGLAEHVILRRIEDNKKLPKKARKESKHPDAGSNLWRRWKSLIRATKLKIRPGEVDEKWLDYDQFKQDVYQGFSPELNMVRIANDRPWGPDNFKWVSVQERVELTHGKSYTIKGRNYPSLAAISRDFGIGVTTLRDRLGRQGMSLEDAVALDLAPNSYRTRKTPVKLDGIEFPTMNQAVKYAAEHYNITVHQAKDRLRRSVPLDNPNQAKPCLVEGIHFPSEAAAARHYGVNKSTFGVRRRLGWSLEQALGLVHPPKKK